MTNWKAISRVYRGVAHRDRNLPCQDYAGYEILPNGILIGAIADGAGSARYSDVGSGLAVECLLQHLETELQQNGGRVPDTELGAREWFGSLGNIVVDKLQQQAQQQQCSIHELACTLLAFIASPQGMAAMQIGDGFMVVRFSTPFCQRAAPYQLLFQPDKGEYANQTTFVTSEHAVQDMQVRVLQQPPEFICAATDGLESVAIRQRDWTPHPPFFQPFDEYLAETPEPEEAPTYLEQFLTSDRLNERTTDDKTMLLAQLQAEPGSHENTALHENQTVY